MVRLIASVGVLILAILCVNCGAYYKERSEKIAAATEVLLRNGDFEKLYDALDGSARSLTPRAEFFERGERLVGFMKQADPDLRFVKSREGGVNADALSDMYFEYRELGSGDKKIQVEVWITLDRGIPALFDVCANPASSETVETQHCLTNALRKI